MQPVTAKSKIFFIPLLLAGILFVIPSISLNLLNFTNSFSGMLLNVEFWNFGLHHFGIELTALGILLGASQFFSHPRWLLYIATVVFLFFIFLFQYAVNVPITDDYYAILNFFNHYFSAENRTFQFTLLASFYDDSRLVVIRSVFMLFHYFTGAINFKTLILISNVLLLPLLLWLFYKLMPASKYRLQIILIIAILLFQFGYYDAILWIIPAMHYKLVVVCVMPTLFFIRKQDAAQQLMAAVCTIVAIFSVGNGWLIFPIIFLYFVIEKKWGLLALWLFLALILMSLYFYEDNVVKHCVLNASILDYFIFSCCFLGSAFQFLYKLQLPFIFGCSLWIFFIVLTIKKYYNTNFPVYGLLLFIILSSLMAAHFRLYNAGMFAAIANRYGFYSLIAFSSSMIALFQIVDEKKQKLLFPAILILSISYHLLAGIFFFPEVPLRKAKLEKFISEIKENQDFHPIEPIIPNDADTIVKEAIAKRIYFP